MKKDKKDKSSLSKVKVKKLDKKEDNRGFVAEIVRVEDLSDPDKKFGQIYVTTAKPGHTKGKHYHNRKTEWFCVILGNGLLTLVDKKSKEKKEIKMGEDNMVAVEIPPGVWHAISNEEGKDMYLVAHISESFNPEDPDTIYEETP